MLAKIDIIKSSQIMTKLNTSENIVKKFSHFVYILRFRQYSAEVHRERNLILQREVRIKGPAACSIEEGSL